MKILLSGYYGHGNFGDDILFIATLGLVRGWWPEASIAVQSEAPDPSYLDGLAGTALPIVRLGEPTNFDLIVHGGGGTFFDFGTGGAIHVALNGLARLIGSAAFVRAHSFSRKINGLGPVEAATRVSLGVGVGTYTRSSRRLRSELPVLEAMDFLSVRDAGSVDNLRALGVKGPIHRTGDVAFLGGWGETLPYPTGGPLVAVVRDWGNEVSNQQQLAVLRTVAERHPVKVLLFDELADRGIAPLLRGLDVACYSPGHTRPIIQALGAAPAIITARAHGAICGAMLGTPSYLLPIEPKLASVHQMLRQSTVLFDWKDDALAALRATLLISDAAILEDVAHNKALLSSTIAKLRRELVIKCLIKADMGAAVSSCGFTT